MNITLCADRDSLPDKIKSALEDANVFFSSDWYAYTRHRGEEIVYIYSDAYILAMRVKKVRFLKGGILDGETFVYSDPVDGTEKEFLNAACAKLKKTKTVDWVQTEISSCFMDYPDGAVTYGAGNFILDLENNTEEELFKKVHSKNRNMIRRGQKEGIEIRRGPELAADYKSVEDQVWAREHRAPRSLEHYTEMLDNMPDTTSIAVAYNRDGVPEAGGIFLYTKAMGYYHHGASKDDPTPGAHNYLIWEQILYLKSIGVKKLNFVGYRRPSEVNPNIKAYGIQNFKERFGGDVLEAYAFRYNCSDIKFAIYRLASVILYKEDYGDAFAVRSKHYPEMNGGKA